MAEMERFEARLAAAIDRLADEAPTTVDDQQLARAIASAEAAHHPIAFRLGWRLRIAVAVILILALAIAMVALAERIAPAPLSGSIIGRLACTGPPWVSSDTVTVALECSSDLGDPRFSGWITIDIGEADQVDGVSYRAGRVALRMESATCAGRLRVTEAPNGMAVADAALACDAALRGTVLTLRFVTGDGLSWSVLGSFRGGE